MSCPICEKEMEEGNLQFVSTAGFRIAWQKERSRLHIGEILDWGYISTDHKALRCPDCKLVFFKYASTSSPPSVSGLDDPWRSTFSSP
jgi:hypothetical protein